MGLEEKFNRWLIGAVMGKKYVWKYKHLSEEHHQEEKNIITDTKKEIGSLKKFFQGGVKELRNNVREKQKRIRNKKYPKQPETNEER